MRFNTSFCSNSAIYKKVSENRQKREGDGSVNESTFSNSANIRAPSRVRIGLIQHSHLPHPRLAPRSINDNYQSDGFGLAVRN